MMSPAVTSLSSLLTLSLTWRVQSGRGRGESQNRQAIWSRQPLPFLPKQSEEFKKSCNSQRAADWQAGARRIWTKWGDREQLKAIGWVRTSTRRLVVAICEWWTCLEDKRVEKNYPGESHTSIMCTIVGDLFIMWQEEVIFKQIGEGGEDCNYRMIMWKFSTTSMA